MGHPARLAPRRPPLSGEPPALPAAAAEATSRSRRVSANSRGFAPIRGGLSPSCDATTPSHLGLRRRVVFRTDPQVVTRVHNRANLQKRAAKPQPAPKLSRTTLLACARPPARRSRSAADRACDTTTLATASAASAANSPRTQATPRAGGGRGFSRKARCHDGEHRHHHASNALFRPPRKMACP